MFFYLAIYIFFRFIQKKPCIHKYKGDMHKPILLETSLDCFHVSIFPNKCTWVYLSELKYSNIVWVFTCKDFFITQFCIFIFPYDFLISLWSLQIFLLYLMSPNNVEGLLFTINISSCACGERVWFMCRLLFSLFLMVKYIKLTCE